MRDNSIICTKGTGLSRSGDTQIQGAGCHVSILNTDHVCSIKLRVTEYVKPVPMSRQSHKSWLPMAGMLLIAMSNDCYPGGIRGGDNRQITPEF